MKLKEKYQKEAVPKMMEKFGYKNKMAVPRIDKVVVNTGFGRLIAGKTSEEQKKICAEILGDLALICGQKPILTKAKKSIATYKTREGMAIGAKVTLRGQKMYDFLERLINIGLPRSRDFRGLEPSAVDKRGNLNIGIKEHTIFPEISPEKSKVNFGLEATVVITARNQEKGLGLAKMLGFPIKKSK